MPNVRVRITSQADLSGDGVEQQEKQQAQMSTTKVATLSLLGHQAINTAKQVLNYSINNIGQYTGNSVLQENLTMAVGVVGDVASIGMATATMGWVGLAVSTISVATKYTLNAISINEQIRKDNFESAYIRERSGNPITDGSRYGR